MICVCGHGRDTHIGASLRCPTQTSDSNGVFRAVARKIVYMSRERAEAFEPPENSAILSIHTPGDKPANLKNWDFFVRWPRQDDSSPMTSEEVDQIWAWVEENKHRNLYVHCDAGISRSGGVAHAIALYLNAVPEALEHSQLAWFREMEDNPRLVMADFINSRIKSDLVRRLWEQRLVGD